MNVKQLSLRPYHGTIHVCNSLESLQAEYRRITGQEYPFNDDGNGRYIKLDGDNGDVLWLAWGDSIKSLVHELSHILLHTFGHIGHDPTQGDGEPFCYMLSALMDECGIDDGV